MNIKMSLGDWLLGSMPVLSIFLLFAALSVESQGGNGMEVFLAIPIGWAIAIVVKMLE